MAASRPLLLPIVLWGAVAILAAPVLALGLALFLGAGETLRHLMATVLPDVLLTTAILFAIVAAGTSSIGVITAWLVTNYRFPLSRQFEWLLLLPLSVPTYIIGYVYTDALAYAGPVQTALRRTFGWTKADYWFPDIQNVAGVGVVLSLVLFPYVFLVARAAFLEQSAGLTEAARLLGYRPLEVFRRIALPLARPAIIAGVTLALMEALADFATVQYFGVNTFTTAIYKAWIGMDDRIAAAQLSALLLVVVLTLVLIERAARKGTYSGGSRRGLAPAPVLLSGGRAALAVLACALPVVLGFVVPVGLLLANHLSGGDPFLGERFLTYAWNSFRVAGIAMVVLVGLALAMGHLRRLRPTRAVRALVRVASGGYAVPGTVIAVGVMIVLGAADRLLADIWAWVSGQGVPLLFSGSLFALVYAYCVRFLAVASEPVQSGYTRVSANLDHAARTLGASGGEIARRIHLPLLRRPILVAALLAFVEVLKELPATLIVRPFNFDTLAIRVYNLASDERLVQASTGALALVVIGLVPVIILTRMIASGRQTPR